MVRLTIFMILVFVAGGTSWAQAPVPEGQARPTLDLQGTVLTAQGDLLENIQITVSSSDSDKRYTAKTDSTGDFTLKVPAGHYTVKATAQGFAETTASVNVLPNQMATVRLVLGGPVPDGEAAVVPRGVPPPASNPIAQGLPGNVPIPARGAVAVTGQFASWQDLAGWLNGQSARHLRLQAIITTGGYKNLFVWISGTGTDQHIVVPANQINNPNDLQGVLNAYPQATIIGLSWVSHDRFLILRSNP